MSTQPARPRTHVTVNDLRRMKATGEPIAMVTAYDATAARLVAAAGIFPAEQHCFHASSLRLVESSREDATQDEAPGWSRGHPGLRMASVDRDLMRLAIREAAKGIGQTAPNPAVGAVIARNARVVAVGHHARVGAPHAEAMALLAAGELAHGADLYTTLEPCDHWGRTPPCSRAIIEAGVKRVFIGSRDPNPLANGRGVARLRAAGVEVALGVLEPECDALNLEWFRQFTACAALPQRQQER